MTEQHNHEFQDRDAPANLGWHLDKKVPLSLIAAMIVQVLVVMMFAADLKRDVELLKAKTAAIEVNSKDDRNALRDSLQIIREQFTRMDGKLDRLVERDR